MNSTPNDTYVLINASIVVAKDDNGNTESVPLNAATLGIVGQTASPLPFLCTSRPLNVAKLAGLAYEDRIEKFFDASKLSKYLLPTPENEDDYSLVDRDTINYMDDTGATHWGIVSKKSDSGGDAYDLTVSNNDGSTSCSSLAGGTLMVNVPYKKIRSANNRSMAVYNFINMLVLMFPTNIPVMNNVIFSSRLAKPATVSWIQMKHAGDQLYSYLYSGSQIRTITQTIWVNDVRNNPRYSVLISQLNAFDAWRKHLLSDFNGINSEAVKLVELLRTAVNLPPQQTNGYDWNVILNQMKKVMQQTTNNPNLHSSISDQYQELIDAMTTIKNKLTPATPATETATPEMATLEELVKIIPNEIRRIRDLDTLISGASTTAAYTPIRQAIQRLSRFLKQHAIMDKQEKAVKAVREINIQYGSNSDLASYLPTVYPQFTQFAEAVKTFQSTTYIDNDFWRNRIDKLVQSSTNNDMVFSDILCLTTRNDAHTQWVGFDSPTNEKTGGNFRTVVVDLRMNIIEGKITPDNVNTIICPFRDNYLGGMFTMLTKSREFDWKLPPIGYFSAVEYLANEEKEKKQTQEKAKEKAKERAPKKTLKTGGGGRKLGGMKTLRQHEKITR